MTDRQQPSIVHGSTGDYAVLRVVRGGDRGRNVRVVNRHGDAVWIWMGEASNVPIPRAVDALLRVIEGLAA